MGFETNDALLEAVSAAGLDYEVLGHARFDEPIVTIDAGGTQDPGVLIATGAHATEHAGVAAAVTVSEELVTDQRVTVIPTRDPIGLNGYEWALDRVLGRNVDLQSFKELAALLREEGDAVYESEGLTLALLDDLGFAAVPPGQDGESSQFHLLKRFKAMQHKAPEALDPYRGRQILLPAGQPKVPSNENFDRAYSMVISPDGESLHFNRFFDRAWAPVETRAVRNVIEQEDPGLVFDLHETQVAEDRVFLTLNDQASPERNDAQQSVAKATIAGATAAGGETAHVEDIEAMATITKADPDAETGGLYDPVADGIYRKPDPERRNEGQNLTDYATADGRIAMTLETGMLAPEAQRADLQVRAVKRGLEAFSELNRS